MSRGLEYAQFDTSELYRAFGRGVRIVRKQKRIRQTDIARSTGLSPTTISNIEHGNPNASIASVVAIARYLETTIGKLIRIGLEAKD